MLLFRYGVGEVTLFDDYTGINKLMIHKLFGNEFENDNIGLLLYFLLAHE